MKLTEQALELINEQNLRLKLGLALGFSEQWIIRLIKSNKENGDLTTAAALKLIAEETGLTNEQILLEEPQKKTKPSHSGTKVSV